MAVIISRRSSYCPNFATAPHRLRCRSFSLCAWLSLLGGICRRLRSRLRIVGWLRRNVVLIRKFGVHICAWLSLISSRCRFFIATLVATCFFGSLCAWLGLFCFLGWSFLGVSVRAWLGFRCLFCLRGGSTYAGYSAERDQRGSTGGNSGADLDHWPLSTMWVLFSRSAPFARSALIASHPIVSYTLCYSNGCVP